MTPRHFAHLESARTIRTKGFALTAQAVEEIWRRQAMGVIYGSAGLGKTFAVEDALSRQGDIEHYWFDFPERTTPKWLTIDLLYLLTGIEHEGEHRKLSRELLRVLAERSRFLVVDEAQRLNRTCVEYLRHLHDRTSSKFALLLVGGNGCWQTLSRHPMLSSRIWRRVEFEPMTTQTVLKVIPRFHPIYHDVEPELLVFVDDYLTHGNFRHWAGFTASAVDFLTGSESSSSLDEGVARAVFAKHRGGADAA